MNHEARQAVEACTRLSDAERVTFGEVVGRLLAAGIERYHADLLRADKIYYLPGGESHRTPNHALAAPPAMAFSAPGVDAAVRAVQQGRIRYREFCARIAAAGCVGYIVSLAGRRAIYYGRKGDFHVEPFPPAPGQERHDPPR
ncbi:DUF1398 domain-containing protein [Roseococcus sp. SYP-B2431]|uniref:DUF1398 family protein n=1 Tax=Roseococcus sp. SYP-B2431 TaxID=2496640 RepID=UPI00103F6434|nr:DUF1398 family protein [Roseococcus sp. SYP-B2431]TCH96683.1 DUF1398 domain-containing protein [Roseococcus sp. SYP-B2431]